MSNPIVIEQCFCGKCNIEGVDLIPWIITWSQDGKTWEYANQLDVMRDNLSKFLDEKYFNKQCLVREGHYLPTNSDEDEVLDEKYHENKDEHC